MGEPTEEGVQVTLVQLDSYGPWTVTPTPRREMDLQALQARPFADLADFVDERDGDAFFERFDNVFAVTNGVGERAHARFVGGDDVVAVCPPMETDDFDAARGHVREAVGVDLQVGVGRGTTARAAGHRAKLAIEQCREPGHRIRRAGRHVATD